MKPARCVLAADTFTTLQAARKRAQTCRAARKQCAQAVQADLAALDEFEAKLKAKQRSARPPRRAQALEGNQA
jgi:hypothetical protein